MLEFGIWDRETDTVKEVSAEEYIRQMPAAHDGPDYSAWFAKHKRVALTEVGDYKVSTVFLTVEHFDGMWFETMIADRDSFLDNQWRYKTAAEARTGHEKVVAWVKAGCPEESEP
jgi:hypothetical protein